MYEYFVIRLDPRSVESLENTISQLTLKDLKWELVTVNKDNQYIFRRPKV